MTAALQATGGIVVIALLLIAAGVRLLLTVTADRRTTRVLSRIDALAVVGNVVAAARDARAARRAAAWMPRRLQALFGQANVRPSGGMLLGLAAAAAVAAAAAGGVGGPSLAALGGVAVVGAELAVLRALANRRLAQFTLNLPVFLEKIVQLVKVGNSLRQALVRSSAASPPIITAYLAPVLRRIENGASVEDALGRLADRLDVIEFHMLIVTLEANLIHGGRLSNTIGILVQILRDKQRIDREMRASTSEGRATAWIVGALPVTVASFEWFRFPEFLIYFLKTPQGHVMLGVALALEGLGVLLLNRLLKVSY